MTGAAGDVWGLSRTDCGLGVPVVRAVFVKLLRDTTRSCNGLEIISVICDLGVLMRHGCQWTSTRYHHSNGGKWDSHLPIRGHGYYE
eukprot:256854-Prymnesium_polylepis.1